MPSFGLSTGIKWKYSNGDASSGSPGDEKEKENLAMVITFHYTIQNVLPLVLL